MKIVKKLRAKFWPLGQLFCPSLPLAYSLHDTGDVCCTGETHASCRVPTGS